MRARAPRVTRDIQVHLLRFLRVETADARDSTEQPCPRHFPSDHAVDVPKQARIGRPVDVALSDGRVGPQVFDRDDALLNRLQA